MADVRRKYVPADRFCLTAGIGLSFGMAGLVWLSARPISGFAVLALGVIAAVGGMLLAGLCARSRERNVLGRTPGPHRAAKSPAENALDPFHEREEAEHQRACRPAGRK